MTRLFTALLPPPAVRAALAELAAPQPGVRWTAPDHLHLTLRFIGECDDPRQEGFAKALGRVRVEPFILPVTGLGVFPSRGTARVLWAGVGQAHPRLFQLRQQVDEALLSVDPALDVHSFHPHFTLGRLGPECEPRALAGFLARHAAFEAPPFRVEAIHLMASELFPGRAPAYRTVRTYAL